MFEAIKNNELEKLEALLNNNPQLANLPDKSGILPVEVAVNFQKLEALELLVNKGATLKTDNIDGLALIHANKAILDYLKSKNVFDGTLTELHIQASLKIEDREAFKKLISINDINAKYKDRFTPLMMALIKNNMEAVECIYACMSEKNKEANEIWIKEFKSKKDGNTFLHELAYEDQLEVCQFLVENNIIEVDVKNLENITPLEIALLRNKIKTAKYLYKQSTKNIEDQEKIKKSLNETRYANGNTLMHLLAEKNCTESCRFLVGNNIIEEIYVKNSSNIAPLMAALLNESIETAKYLYKEDEAESKKLLKEGRDRNGDTFLHTLAKRNAIESCRFLVDNNIIEVDVKNSDNLMPLAVALLSKSIKTAKYFYEESEKNTVHKDASKKWLKECRVEGGNTLLDRFVVLGCTEEYEFLLDNHVFEADVEYKLPDNTSDKDQLTILKLLLIYGHGVNIKISDNANKNIDGFITICRDKAFELKNLLDQKKWVEIKNKINDDAHAEFFINSTLAGDSFLDRLTMKACTFDKDSDDLNQVREILKKAKKKLPKGAYDLYKIKAINYFRKWNKPELADIFQCTSETMLRSIFFDQNKSELEKNIAKDVVKLALKEKLTTNEQTVEVSCDRLPKAIDQTLLSYFDPKWIKLEKDEALEQTKLIINLDDCIEYITACFNGLTDLEVNEFTSELKDNIKTLKAEAAIISEFELPWVEMSASNVASVVVILAYSELKVLRELGVDISRFRPKPAEEQQKTSTQQVSIPIEKTKAPESSRSRRDHYVGKTMRMWSSPHQQVNTKDLPLEYVHPRTITGHSN